MGHAAVVTDRRTAQAIDTMQATSRNSHSADRTMHFNLKRARADELARGSRALSRLIPDRGSAGVLEAH
jgi:hypothetical protein